MLCCLECLSGRVVPAYGGNVCPIRAQVRAGKTLGKEDELPAVCRFFVLEGLVVSSSFGRRRAKQILASKVSLCVSIDVFYRHCGRYGMTACH